METDGQIRPTPATINTRGETACAPQTRTVASCALNARKTNGINQTEPNSADSGPLCQTGSRYFEYKSEFAVSLSQKRQPRRKRHESNPTRARKKAGASRADSEPRCRKCCCRAENATDSTVPQQLRAPKTKNPESKNEKRSEPIFDALWDSIRVHRVQLRAFPPKRTQGPLQGRGRQATVENNTQSAFQRLRATPSRAPSAYGEPLRCATR
jgi:hypothetical protein